MEHERGDIVDFIKTYYGQRLRGREDQQWAFELLPTCHRTSSPLVRQVIQGLHPDIINKDYGCAPSIPPCLQGQRVLDLGCGSGLDVFCASKLVGENGHVTGIDLTSDQLNGARKYVDYHTKLYGYARPNVEFIEGNIQKLTESGLPLASYDVIISNCVIDLCDDKAAVFSRAFHMLKEGGELYFGDMYAQEPPSEKMRQNQLLWVNGFGGALTWKGFCQVTHDAGFSKPYLMYSSKVRPSKEAAALMDDIPFIDATFRLFKLPPKVECKTKWRITYRGTIDECPSAFHWDLKTLLKVGEQTTVSAEIGECLRCSRYAAHFEFEPTNEPCDDSEEIHPFEVAIDADC